MAEVYHNNIIDIDLESGTLFRSFLNHTIGSGDNNANWYGVRVFRKGEPIALSGCSVQGLFMPASGSAILISDGTHTWVSGNEAAVLLPQACYNVKGRFTLTIKIIGTNSYSITDTVRIIDGVVADTYSENPVAPTAAVPTYQEILAVYEQMVAAKEGSVRFDIDQTLTAAQMTQARGNIAAASESDVSDLKSALNGSINNLDDGKRKISDTFVFGTLDTDGVLVDFANNSRCTGVEYYTAKTGDILTLDSGYSMILCEYNSSKVLQTRGVKSAGDYPLTNGNLYRVTIWDANQTIQDTPYDFAFAAHLPTKTSIKIDGIDSEIDGIQDELIINDEKPTVTYHNDGYVNASTNEITEIATTANYFYSDLFLLNRGETIKIKYHDTLDVVWILSEWADSSTFSRGILAGNSHEGEQEYSFTASNDMYIRHSARYENYLVIKKTDPTNLDVVKNAVAEELNAVDYGFLLNSFLKIGAVGDSLASGECISGTPGSTVANDLYDHSWLQYMARFYGFTGINFSKGGMTTRGWLFDDDYNQQGWTKAQIEGNLCNAYIIGLGANDMTLLLEDSSYLGTPADIGTTNPTFYRYYAQIISNLKTIQPKAKFFLFTLTWLYTETAPYNTVVDDINGAITYIANNTENCYLIDLDTDRWFYGEDNTGNKRVGHYNAIGYNMQGMHLAKLIGNYMHKHQNQFRQIEFIGTNLSYTE